MKRTNLILPTMAAAGVAVGLWFAVSSPPDRVQGDFVRIMYVHVPSAWLAFLAFGVTLVGSVGWRITKWMGWDRLAAASAEVGVLFTAVTLTTGMIWGRPVWGVWWDWGDARMTTTALLFFVYLGYLALRRSVPDPEDRARRSSLWGMVAFVQVPLVYFSVNLFRTLHQTQSIRPDGSTMDPGILAALLANIGAFTLLYLTLLISRTRLLGREAEAEAALPEAVAGSTVAAPRLGEATDG